MPEASPSRVLLLAEKAEAHALAGVIHSACGAEVTLAEDLPHCLQLLQRDSYHVLLLEDGLGTTASTQLDAVRNACRGTLILELNLALVNRGRAAIMVQLALQRQRWFEQQAMEAATRRLRDELGASISGLLLQAQLLLHQRETASGESLATLVGLAEALGNRLRPSGEITAQPFCP